MSSSMYMVDLLVGILGLNFICNVLVEAFNLFINLNKTADFLEHILKCSCRNFYLSHMFQSGN